MRAEPSRGLTTADVAARYRVGEDKVRGWIRRGELAAVNTAGPGERPRYVVTAEALAAFEAARWAAAPANAPRKKRAPQTATDYYP